MIRVTGWECRFYENTKICNKKTELSEEELKKAEPKILKKVQKDSFPGEKMLHLKSLSTFKESDEFLRIRRKLLMREDNENLKVPIVLPSDHHVIKNRIFLQTSRIRIFWRVQSLMVELRESYWIVKSRRTIKKGNPNLLNLSMI
ncbi:integrase catalytic domain-containing protein [Nephila pilipes]|uniref:Integrase catalytic domain-containing protein n=1 Tax=Nephila pilipes TaxID=299642 RepID=A0A8X6QFP4_NEPPI|nr:integrase catalytic domain-containing protein [Nephila pilipes]